MDSELLKVVLPAAIALVGTIITVVLGYRYWTRQRRASRRDALLDERARAYKELWEKLEDIHPCLRGRQYEPSQFSQMVREVNAFAMKLGLHIDDQDSSLASRYLESVFEYCSIINNSNIEAAMRPSFETTVISRDVLDRVEGLEAAQEKVRTLRGQIIKRFKSSHRD